MTTHLKPPPHHQPRRPINPSQPSSSSSSPHGPPRPPITAHPTSIISESAVFLGTHRVTIGAGCIVHPRARFFSFSGPINVGDACVVSEKCVVGRLPREYTPASASTSTSTSASPSTTTTTTTTTTKENNKSRGGNHDGSINISASVHIAPGVAISPGVTVHTAAHIDALVALHEGVEIGAHSKVCAGCEISGGVKVREWMIVWGGCGCMPLGQRRRVGAGKSERALNNNSSSIAGEEGKVLDGRVTEEARLIVLQREREALGMLIAPAGRKR